MRFSHFYTAMLALCLFNAGVAEAQQPADKPLMVVRFQQPVVHYQQTLYTAMQKALEANPAMQFDVVAVSPEGSDQMQNAQFARNSQKYGAQIIKSMREMGMPAERMRLSSQPSPYVETSEVHIFVYYSD